jgi:glucan phosphorylase
VPFLRSQPILDGWWAEAYDGQNGFAIGDATVHVQTEEQTAATGKRFIERSRRRSFLSTTSAMKTTFRADGSSE